jgi:hypothetical protein
MGYKAQNRGGRGGGGQKKITFLESAYNLGSKSLCGSSMPHTIQKFKNKGGFGEKGAL